MLPFCDFSNLGSPMPSNASPSGCPSPDFLHSDLFLNIFLNYFGADMLANTPVSAPGPMRLKRAVTDYCKVCQKKISGNGKRSQGPRRHILQCHLNYPIYKCPHCDYSSNYDKSHVSSHKKKAHPTLGGEVIVVDKAVFKKEEEEWSKRCFDASTPPRGSIETAASTKAEVKEEEPLDDVLNLSTFDRVMHSIDNVLSRESSPTPSTVSSDEPTAVVPEMSTEYLQSLLLAAFDLPSKL